MEMKQDEGTAFPPVPVAPGRRGDGGIARASFLQRRRRAPLRDVRYTGGRLPLQADLPPLRFHDRLLGRDLEL